MSEVIEDDAWGRVREQEPTEDDENPAPMSIRQRIRLMGKAALATKAKVVAEGPKQRKIKGLKRHIHYEHY